MKRGFLKSSKTKYMGEVNQNESPSESSTSNRGSSVTSESLEDHQPPKQNPTPKGFIRPAPLGNEDKVRVYLTEHGTDVPAGPGQFFAHKLPPQVLAELKAQGDDRQRVIFRYWPRDPKGKRFVSANFRGKELPGGKNAWGATLYDFFSVRGVPGISSISYSTGSRLTKAMHEFGEFDFAKPEIGDAGDEPEPQERLPCDIGKLIPELENLVKMGLYDNFSTKLCIVDEGIRSIPSSLDWSQHSENSIFDPSHLPFPWPLVPGAMSYPRLTDRLPFHLLPQKLVVHDPWNLLSVHEPDKDIDAPWTSKNDVVRYYSLQLSKDGKAKAAKSSAEAMKLEKEWRESAGRPIVIGPKNGPRVRVFPPLPPVKPQSIPEAHLYIAPNLALNVGSHSVVYRAELELPRDFLMQREMSICEACLEEKATEVWCEGLVDSDIHLDFGWESHPRTCAHAEGDYTKHRGWPSTTRVEVAAKLSFQGDTHLAREAINYQGFPSHFFQHWSGFSLVSPLHRDPVPAGALVPQFYGYYTPDLRVSATKPRRRQRQYLSPILLLEHCGVPIEAEELTRDDKSECASLLFRFHNEGWTHGSFVPRKILMQKGPLMELPLKRGVSDVLSFRMIDFGRSKEGHESSREKLVEKEVGLTLCGLHNRNRKPDADKQVQKISAVDMERMAEKKLARKVELEDRFFVEEVLQ
ncbi:hypothetical protein BJ138DRAFT_112336 [Hygrophoropsis aurantiaca]|uniref:Uncharacterized protein n=1 Tax=Hygrophoropsis aurantiaca TaxID=72124 RepID=A0ACB8ABE6_9AGAM|nr:hypothetical protein BJ138DRAFT_112336 [Hygrophoropsis aurantiaca]